jgi:hypothetical protein
MMVQWAELVTRRIKRDLQQAVTSSNKHEIDKMEGMEKEDRRRKEYQREYSSRRKEGKISIRDAAIAGLPPLPIMCRKKDKRGGNRCECTIVMESRMYQKQIRDDYCAFIKKSQVSAAGNHLLVSYITPIEEADKKNTINSLDWEGPPTLFITNTGCQAFETRTRQKLVMFGSVLLFS